MTQASRELAAIKVLELVQGAAALYHRLILVVAPSGSRKTTTLKTVQERSDAPILNVSLEVSRQLLELTERQRKLQAPRALGDIVAQAAAKGEDQRPPKALDFILLDNVELLFDPGLAIDPLRLLEDISRNWTLVVAWPGRAENGWLTHAQPGHPEYRRYPLSDLMIVTPTVD